MAMVLLSLLHVITAQYALALGGAPYEQTGKQCMKDHQCDVLAGEGCFWTYSGCDRGQCMCDPNGHRRDPVTGQCKPLRLGLEACDEADMCPQGMGCVKGVCQCRHGRMTPDSIYCLSERENLLGEECGKSDKCVHRGVSGYTQQEVHCTINKVCKCNEGFKSDGVSCRKWRLGEYGCTRAYHCEGGAICLDNRCNCPSGYRPVAGNTKCAKRGATYALPIGADCNTIDEKRYCARDLVCHKCASQNKPTCVRYLVTNDRFYNLSGASSSQTSFLSTLVFTLVGVLLRTTR